MNSTEYIAKVIYYYTINKTKFGFLKYDNKVKRFIIVDEKGKMVKIAPCDGLHCGDTYIVKDNDNKWKIAQCEVAKDGLWKMLGTGITEKNCNNNLILYVKDRRLMRLIDNFIDESFKLGELSERFVCNNLVLKEAM